jgi:WD40 repeat protein
LSRAPVYSADRRAAVFQIYGLKFAVRDTKSQKNICEVGPLPAFPVARALSADAKLLATSCVDENDKTSSGVLQIWDAQSGSLLKTLRGNRGVVQQLVFSPDGKQLVTLGLDGVLRRTELKVWDLETGTPRDLPWDVPRPGQALCIDNTGKKLAVASAERGQNFVEVIDLGTGKSLIPAAPISVRPKMMTFSPDSQRLAIGFSGGDHSGCGVELVELGSGEELLTLDFDDPTVSDIAFSTDGTKLAAATAGLLNIVGTSQATVYVCDAGTGR